VLVGCRVENDLGRPLAEHLADALGVRDGADDHVVPVGQLRVGGHKLGVDPVDGTLPVAEEADAGRSQGAQLVAQLGADGAPRAGHENAASSDDSADGG